jgi:hypothetical protein
MKIRILLILLVVVCFQLGMGQNLVPNPSFESVVTAPCSWLLNPSDLPAAVTNWTMPSNGSTDIFSNMVATSCYAHNFSTNGSAIGQQAPRTGNVQSALVTYGAGCGSVPNYREYLQVQLTSPMATGSSYDFEFWLSMADYSNTATNNFGVYFSTTNVFQSTCFVLTLTPQFNSTTIITNKTGWVRVNGSIIATANWSRIVIGNFFSNAATATQSVGGSLANTRYYIDDIAVTPAVILPAPNLVLSGGRNQDGSVGLHWGPLETSPTDGLLLQRSTVGDVWETVASLDGDATAWKDQFAPESNLLYRLRYVDQNGQSLATENLLIGPATGNPYRIYLTNNPAAITTGNTHLRIANADATPAHVTIADINGHVVWTSPTRPLLEWDHAALPLDLLRPAVYFVRLHTRAGALTTKLLVTE